MAKNLIQFRYFGEGSENNYPINATKQDFSTGDVFIDYLPIAQLGIQTLPGVKFYLNESVYPIIVGHSGIYDLMATGTLKITKLEFDLSSLERISEEQNSYLIVDILYGEEE